uniref:AlNc14C23G2322 protein n=1 Tax=Albugo laibachii Nc14 TaxID=890382 RepID=F0W617_9STRA|nr:AlNc14C23G2322 [Albugo laibachii Nc14]|eukprot:CCA16559.1 AlNc14C23G2322 [Albugo laibachii Nc14]
MSHSIRVKYVFVKEKLRLRDDETFPDPCDTTYGFGYSCQPITVQDGYGRVVLFYNLRFLSLI